MPSQRPLPLRRARITATVATLGLALAACSSGGSDSSATPTATPTSSVSVPAGVSLTAEGSTLTFGKPATVQYSATQKRGSVLELTVKSAAKGSLSDFKRFILDDTYKKKASYYYVDVSVKNVGESGVGGVPVPLWGVDGKNVLLPAVNFTTGFKKCPSKALPATFAPGDSFSTCLVYLSPDHGTLQAVSYRPTQAFNPITWTGQTSTPKPEPKKTDQPKKPKKSQKG